jgi:hypothetical protein
MHMNSRGSIRHNRALATPLKLTVLCVSISAALSSADTAYAQDATEEIVITGSRIVRRDLEAPSPVLTVDTAAFEQ